MGRLALTVIAWESHEVFPVKTEVLKIQQQRTTGSEQQESSKSRFLEIGRGYTHKI
jgi:hypothetical protein